MEEEEELGGVTTIAIFLAIGVAWRLFLSRVLAAILASLLATYSAKSSPFLQGSLGPDVAICLHSDEYLGYVKRFSRVRDTYTVGAGPRITKNNNKERRARVYATAYPHTR